MQLQIQAFKYHYVLLKLNMLILCLQLKTNDDMGHMPPGGARFDHNPRAQSGKSTMLTLPTIPDMYICVVLIDLSKYIYFKKCLYTLYIAW